MGFKNIYERCNLDIGGFGEKDKPIETGFVLVQQLLQDWEKRPMPLRPKVVGKYDLEAEIRNLFLVSLKFRGHQ